MQLYAVWTSVGHVPGIQFNTTARRAKYGGKVPYRMDTVAMRPDKATMVRHAHAAITKVKKNGETLEGEFVIECLYKKYRQH